MFSLNIKPINAKPHSNSTFGYVFILLLAGGTLVYYEAKLSAFIDVTLLGE